MPVMHRRAALRFHFLPSSDDGSGGRRRQEIGGRACLGQGPHYAAALHNEGSTRVKTAFDWAFQLNLTPQDSQSHAGLSYRPLHELQSKKRMCKRVASVFVAERKNSLLESGLLSAGRGLTYALPPLSSVGANADSGSRSGVRGVHDLARGEEESLQDGRRREGTSQWSRKKMRLRGVVATPRLLLATHMPRRRPCHLWKSPKPPATHRHDVILHVSSLITAPRQRCADQGMRRARLRPPDRLFARGLRFLMCAPGPSGANGACRANRLAPQRKKKKQKAARLRSPP
ncbi:hypothetical protein SKAU_G00004290 [Synaphobranchus kaupii]|uniref:Uncharacterized protein n=1 Tax=Synaphobranchus kaupii TaxID=118154 RepID=A0A9Q1G8T8_SYNKA|nr:hypothetical protein SKAU_G00004290 [Synaphobranchus kaupii]